MTSFNNAQSVQNQAGNQTINGDVYFYGESSASSRRPQLNDTDPTSTKAPDEDILRSLAFPQMLDRRSNVSLPHIQTCQWIFDTEEYQHWQGSRSGLLWIKGKPGSGKSTLMSHLYRQIWSEQTPDANSREIFLEFFFSARGAPLQRTPLGMFRSLLNQIFRQHTETRELLRRSFRDKCMSFGSSTDGKTGWEWQRPELEALFTDLVLAAAHQRQITVFVDALDEAGQREAQEIARYFHKINKQVVDSSAAARICISCRHYPIPSLVSSTEVHVEQHNRDDIAAYIRDHINIENLPTNEKWTDLIDDLIDQARGVFQWVCLVVPMVENHIADGDSLGDIRQWIRQVPAELEDMYKHIIQNVVQPRHRTKSFLLFRWVCLAVRPLSVKELSHALATHSLGPSSSIECGETQRSIETDSTMEQKIKSCSGGLLEIMWTDQDYPLPEKHRPKIVQVAHQSVRDFFITQGLPTFATLVNEVSKTVEECHGTLYWSCLKYMSTINTEHLNKAAFRRLSSDQLWLSGRSWLGRKMKERYPLIGYAARYTLVHAEDAEGARGNNFVEELRLLNQLIPALVVFWDHEASFKRDVCTYPGTTPLHLAAFAGLTDIVKYILSDRANNDVDVVDKQGQSALHIAADRGHVAVAEALVSAGASLDLATRDDETALIIAARSGHRKLFSFFLAHSARFAEGSTNHLDTLYTSTKDEESNVAKIRIGTEASGDAHGKYHNSALQAASYYGRQEIVKMLIDAKADVNGRGRYGTALHAASINGHTDVVRMLIKAGADVNDEGGVYGTALLTASILGHEAVVRVLIQAGADVNAPGGLYDTALHAASGNGSVGVVRILLEAGADVNSRGGGYSSALQAASSQGLDEVVQILLDAGAT